MSYTNDLLVEVWCKAAVVDGEDPAQFRKDTCGAWIGLQFYGDRDSQYGWEVDHIIPGAGDELWNLRPLQWENNVAKSDGTLRCVVTASGIENVPVNRTRTK